MNLQARILSLAGVSAALAIAGPAAMQQEADKSDRAPSPQPASATRPARSRPIPWVELNVAAEPYYSSAIRGCVTWASVLDEVCVTSEPRSVAPVYRRLREDLPALSILPGIKTNPALNNRLDNVAGWKTVGESAQLACRLTGNPRCVIENESGWDGYLKGAYEPDWQRVRDGLAALPKDIHYLWYPAVCGALGTPIRERTERFIMLVVELVPNVTLVSTGWGTKPGETDRAAIEMDRRNRSLADSVELCYFYDRAERRMDWSDEDVPHLMEHVPTAEFFIYPGWIRFPDAAAGVSRRLRAWRDERRRVAGQRLAVAQQALFHAALTGLPLDPAVREMQHALDAARQAAETLPIRRPAPPTTRPRPE